MKVFLILLEMEECLRKLRGGFKNIVEFRLGNIDIFFRDFLYVRVFCYYIFLLSNFF